MAEGPSLRLEPKAALGLKQSQRLMMLPQMQQALHLLQAPVIELAALLETEMEQNPILEPIDDTDTVEAAESEEEFDPEAHEDAPPEREVNFDDNDFTILKQLDEEYRDHFSQIDNYALKRTADEDKRKTFLETVVCDKETLYTHCVNQARETFATAEEFKAAELLIGYLDENGLISTPLAEISALDGTPVSLLESVLSQIQGFDPIGVGAANLQEALLIQLRSRGQEDSLAYAIVSQHYEDMLHNRIPTIAKAMGVSATVVTEAITRDIAHLDLHPASWFSRDPVQTIVPDAVIRLEEGELFVDINDEPIRNFRVSTKYLRMLEDESVPVDAKNFIKEKLASAKWLLRNVHQRNDTVVRITQLLATYQKEFFLSPDGTLVPLTMKVIAEELELHESTIARAVSNKYIDTPRGVLALRYFFTNAYTTDTGADLSSRTVRDALQRMIDRENKGKPLSDEALSRLLKERGMPCARRTVAKYRNELNIGTALQRRTYE